MSTERGVVYNSKTYNWIQLVLPTIIALKNIEYNARYYYLLQHSFTGIQCETINTYVSNQIIIETTIYGP
jgi:hypothetical protein